MSITKCVILLRDSFNPPIFAEKLWNMDIKKGDRLREEWGGKHCDHPSFEKETQGAPIVKGMGYVEVKTGDYICTQCGEAFTKAEKEAIEKNRK